MNQLTKISDATVGRKIADAIKEVAREGVGVEEVSSSPKIRHLVKIDRMLISSHSLTLVSNGTRVSNVETDNAYTLGKICTDAKIPIPNDFEKLFIIVKNGVAGGGR